MIAIRHTSNHYTSPSSSLNLTMAAVPSNSDIRVKLTNPSETPGAFEDIEVKDRLGRVLNISLRRTIRVPDNAASYNLPPDLGAFPIYSVQEHQARLPDLLVKKGGIFIPIYRKPCSESS